MICGWQVNSTLTLISCTFIFTSNCVLELTAFCVGIDYGLHPEQTSGRMKLAPKRRTDEVWEFQESPHNPFLVKAKRRKP